MARSPGALNFYLAPRDGRAGRRRELTTTVKTPLGVRQAMGHAAQEAKAAFMAALAAVDPTRLVKAAVREGLLDDWFHDRFSPRPIHVIAIGKAAPRMVWGLVEANVPFSGIGAAPAGVAFPQLEGFTWHKGEHPVPGAGSFAAGRAVEAWARSLPEGSHVLALVSGGGSACMEATHDEALVEDWRQWLRQALPIAQMNARRSARSRLKAGRLGRMLLERAEVRAWVLSDTPEGASTVASAPFHQASEPDRIPHRVLADSDAAVAAAGHSLMEAGRPTFRFPRRLDGALHTEVKQFLEMAAGLPPGSALVGAGEPLVAVEADAPPGGRCQHAALQAAMWLRDHGAPHTFLAAGTDGIDGTTREAGACVTGADAGPGADEALLARDAHRFLAKRTIHTGATGTNVNDLWIAIGE